MKKERNIVRYAKSGHLISLDCLWSRSNADNGIRSFDANINR